MGSFEEKLMKTFFQLVLILLAPGELLFAQGGFTKIIDAANPVTTFTTAGIYKGAAWVDFDNDHDIDLYAAPNRLFRNDGNGVFIQLIDLPFHLFRIRVVPAGPISIRMVISIVSLLRILPGFI